MASVISWRSPIGLQSHLHLHRLPPPPPSSKLPKASNASSVIPKITSAPLSSSHLHPRRAGVMRRDTFLAMLLSAFSFSFPTLVSSAEKVDLQGSFRAYEDQTNKFRIFVPQGWSVGAGETNTIQSVTAFYPEEAAASTSNVSIAITGLGPDFTTLGSFGKVDAFAEALVNGLDRSWQRPPGLAAKLINSASANGLYYIEYTLQSPGESRRHIYSAIGMASNGWYNRLYTVTGQFMEDERDKYQSLIEKCVSSFRFT